MKSSELLLEVNSDPRWQLLIKEVESRRPVIPKYNPNKDNTEDWKHKCALQQGFDLCAQIFGIKT